MVTADHI